MFSFTCNVWSFREKCDIPSRGPLCALFLTIRVYLQLISSLFRIGAFECHSEQLLLSVEQDKSQSDDSDMEDGANSESDTDWETLPKSLDIPEDVPIYTNTSTTTSMTLSSGQEESDEGPGTTASLVTSAAASVAALWPWKR